ncbi:MAG: hypothetical protein F4X92_01575 [Gammaproteobacteria bacterium]|nr:hypothetical protein [Gammaproteobacteria bacterium]
MNMRYEDEWASNEDQLMREAGSLGELLMRLRGYFSTLPIIGKQWKRLFENAQSLPPTLAGFPLWMGFSVDKSQSTLLLDVSVLGGTHSADYFRQHAKTGNGIPSTDCIAALLDELDAPDSPLSDIAGNRVLVEYSIEPDRPEQGDCGYFLYPIGPTLAGDAAGQDLSELHVVYDVLSAVGGHAVDSARRRYADRVYLALGPGTRIGAMGAFVSSPQVFRVTMLGFRTPGEIMAYLDRTGWRGKKSLIISVLERLEERGVLSQMQLGVRLDFSDSGFEPTLEVQIFSANTIYDQTGWFKDKECWIDLMNGLREEQIAVPEKLKGLTGWSATMKTLMGCSGLLLLLQRIHHFAIVINGDGELQVNAYLFLLTARWPNSKN